MHVSSNRTNMDRGDESPYRVRENETVQKLESGSYLKENYLQEGGEVIFKKQKASSPVSCVC